MPPQHVRLPHVLPLYEHNKPEREQRQHGEHKLPENKLLHEREQRQHGEHNKPENKLLHEQELKQHGGQQQLGPKPHAKNVPVLQLLKLPKEPITVTQMAMVMVIHE